MVKALPGVVIFTLVSADLRQALQEGCRALNTPCVPILDGVFSALSSLLGAETRPQIGRQHAMDAGYFSRIDAMNFMFRHDDGQCAWELEEADVVLVGVSRTSKTPTSIYLANRGIKAANVPVVPDCPLPAELETLSRPLVVGLDDQPGAAGADPDEPAAAAASRARGRSPPAARASRATMPSSSGCGPSWSMPGACSPATAGR